MPLSPSQLPVSSLAYLGDALIELMVRERLVIRCGTEKVAKLNELAREFITAKAQSAAVELLLPSLTEEETDIFKRGRNASHLSVPKSSSTVDYRRATGLECLFGFLHLSSQTERIRQLFDMCFFPETPENE
jgi:Uncharacterized protein conserved in bacteria